jgi:hypothetical protein
MSHFGFSSRQLSSASFQLIISLMHITHTHRHRLILFIDNITPLAERHAEMIIE